MIMGFHGTRGFLRKAITFLLILTMMSQIKSFHVYAETTSDKIKKAEEEKTNSEEKLSETTGKLSGLKDSKQKLQSYLSDLNTNLEEVSNKLEELEKKSLEKKAEIENTTEELNQAIQEQNEQYEFMKKRIKFVYEKGKETYSDLFFSTSNFGDFLNRAEYISKVNDYDQKMLQKMKDLKEETELKKEELEAEQKELEKLQEDAASEQEKVKSLVNDTSQNISGYSGQISAAEQEALIYEASIATKNNEITILKAQLEKEKEIARRAALMRKKDLSEINIDVSDRELLACLIQCEADGEPWEGKIAVGSVVLNRARSGVYPDTIVGVIYQSGQFAPVASGRLGMRLATGANSTCLSAADEVLAGSNNIGDCLFFRTIIPDLQGTIIGNHIFY
ncbi:MAG: cell wall hydrolase [Lachnospiraceae bacterium]|nr:cell wall hydrolase [Lachnospiraceae bacterium]